MLCETDDMLAVLLTELERAELRELESEGVPSALESSEVRSRSSKLGTGRMVEFMRPRLCEGGDLGLADGDRVLLMFPFMEGDALGIAKAAAALMTPCEACARVDRGVE